MDRLLRAVLKPAPQEQAGDCPDAGVLAAFVEGELAGAEQSALDAHIGTCGRCQEALAILSHDLPPVEAEVAVPESGWFTWVTRPRLRWLVPISAVATVAAVFFATRPLIAPEGEVPGSSVVQMAQAPAPPAESPAIGVDALREKSAAAAAKDEPAGQPERREAPRSLASAPAPAKGETGAAADLQAAGNLVRDKKTAEPAAEMMAARVASEEQRTPPAAPRAVAMRQDAHKVETSLTTVSAPGGTVIWRFGAGGRLSRSGDAGDTWHEQPSGVTTDLLAGAAPSPATCWIVGASGTVLLTTDGEHWERRPFPQAADLVAVTASSARAAIVTARDGRRFETLDAGLTWSPKQ
jgi:hypothetical protein